jgi:hypothetical protein
MTRDEANRILDRCRETSKLSYADTTRALAATGDIEELRSERMDFEIQEESQRPWENECIRLVVSDLIRHREKTWVSRR